MHSHRRPDDNDRRGAFPSSSTEQEPEAMTIASSAVYLTESSEIPSSPSDGTTTLTFPPEHVTSTTDTNNDDDDDDDHAISIMGAVDDSVVGDDDNNDDNDDKETQERFRRWLGCLILLVILVLASLVIWLILLRNNNIDNRHASPLAESDTLSQVPSMAPSWMGDNPVAVPTTRAPSSLVPSVPPSSLTTIPTTTTTTTTMAPTTTTLSPTQKKIQNVAQQIETLLDLPPAELVISLQDPDSPRYKAIEWLATQDQVLPAVAVTHGTGTFRYVRRLAQRYVLALLYYSTTSTTTTWHDRCSFLNTTLHECEWKCSQHVPFSNDDDLYALAAMGIATPGVHCYDIPGFQDEIEHLILGKI